MSQAPDDIGAAQALALSSATFGLAGAHLAPPASPLHPTTWNALSRTLTTERLWGPLAWAAHEGWWPATDEQLDQALAGHRKAMATALGLEQQLLEVTGSLRSQEIDTIVLKGPAVARLDHPEPSLRSFADIDLLVGADDIGRAAALLEAQGGVRRFAQPRRGFDQRFGKGMSLRLRSGHEIDLHRTLALGPFGLRIDAEALRSATTELEIGGETLRALDVGGRFFHACVHASLGSAKPRITTLRDVAVIVGPAAAEDRAMALAPSLELARAWECGLLVAYAVHAAAAAFQWLPPVELREWIDDYEPTDREWRWFAGYRDGARSSARHALDSLSAIDSWTDRLRYVVAVTVPKAPARSARWRRGARDLTGWGQGR